MTVQAKRDILRKLKVLKYVEERGNVSKACRYFGISRESYYKWKKRYKEQGEEGLINSKPCPENHALSLSQQVL